ncbi:hypothetical protein [Rhodobacter sp. SY28-1]|uniref:hypothetical protein n=1 Tax=Rhodobacter sp. SY28-1 TaxID=2562317 RepID=UPI001485355B|nr:hypothetical protein [Rhodobacter sp. SY28-1]
MIDGRFDQHFAEVFAASNAEDDPQFARVLRRIVLVASLLGFVAAAGAGFLG